MAVYAEFKIGGDYNRFVWVQFNPSTYDPTRDNYCNAQAFYRNGAWYIRQGGGMPRDTPKGPNWGIPDAAVAAPSTAPDQAFKADGGKPNWFLLMSGKGCAAALAGVVRVLSFAVRPVAEGGKGYTEHSWRQVPNARERYEAAMYRHLNKIALGELVDDESGESHWDHVATNALFLSELTKAGK